MHHPPVDTAAPGPAVASYCVGNDKDHGPGQGPTGQLGACSSSCRQDYHLTVRVVITNPKADAVSVQATSVMSNWGVFLVPRPGGNRSAEQTTTGSSEGRSVIRRRVPDTVRAVLGPVCRRLRTLPRGSGVEPIDLDYREVLMRESTNLQGQFTTASWSSLAGTWIKGSGT